MSEAGNNPKRACRRNDAERMKAKARKLYPHDKAGKLSDYLAQCSCAMCGNPRKYFNEKARQELAAEIDPHAL